MIYFIMLTVSITKFYATSSYRFVVVCLFCYLFLLVTTQSDN